MESGTLKKKYLLFVILLIFPFTWAYGLTGESKLFSLAETRYFAGNYILALDTYDEFIKNNPLSDLVPDAQFRRAACLYRIGRYDESLALFKRIETHYRSTRFLDYVPFWAGLIFYTQKDYVRAGTSFDLFLDKVKSGSRVPVALLHKGLSGIYLKEYDDAVSAFLRLLDLNRDEQVTVDQRLFASAVVLLGYTCLKAERFDDVLKLGSIYTDVKFTDQEKEKFLFYKAEALWGLNRFDEAKTVYLRLVSAQADTASASYRRLFILAQKEKNTGEMESILAAVEKQFAANEELIMDFWYQSGMERYRENDLMLAEFFLSKVWNLRDKKPVLSVVPRYLGEIYIKQKMYQKATDVLQTYIRDMEHPAPEFLQRLGDIFLMKNDFTQAAWYYREILKHTDDTTRGREISYYLAYALYRGGVLEEALTLITEQLDGFSGGSYHAEFLRLKTLANKKLNRIPEAVSALKQTIAFYPGNPRAYLDLSKLQYVRKDYEGVIKTIEELDANIPSLKEKDTYTYFLSRYFSGLSLIVKKEYEKAARQLSPVMGKDAEQAGLSLIVPYSLFYRAWASYRLGNFKQAAGQFLLIVANYPKHILQPDALYFTGWCWYSAGDFANAAYYFSALADAEPGDEIEAKALFFKAKSLLNLKKNNDAKEIFSSLFNTKPLTSFADDALFEYARVLAAEEKTENAASAYQKLIDTYPNSPLKEESVYLRGELYFQATDYIKARDAFYKYRLTYPKGSLYDAALYWGALCSFSLDEKYAAILLWEIIIDTYKESTFRPIALKKTAEIYMEKGEYSKARSLFIELINAYPREASAVNAQETANKLNLLILGIDEREASLLVIIEQKKGAATPEGKKALLELAKLYLYEQGAGRLGIAYNILIDLAARKEDKAVASQAQFLIGEYFFLVNDYIRAGNEFLMAALMNPEDRDMMAVSIYKAAEMMKRAKKTKEARDLIQRLEKNFPQSEWVLEGKRLLEGLE